VQASPSGGSIVALAQSPSEPVVLYAYAQPGGLFVSADGATTWQPRDLVLDDYYPYFLVSPDDAQTVYVLTAGSLLRTRDGGDHWSAIRPESQTVVGFAVDSGDSQVLFAATPGGLYRSPDGGDTWKLSAFAGAQVLAVASDPQSSPRGSVLFAAIGIGDRNRPVTIWQSADHGATWAAGETLDPPPFGVPAPRFVFDPARPGTMYLLLLTDDDVALFRSADGGAAWTKLAAAAGMRDLAASPGGTLFAATGRGVARSDDGGDTWVRPSPAAPQDVITRVFVSTALEGGVFAAGSAGIWKSGARGRSWTASNQGIVALSAFSLAAAPSGPDTVYAVTGAGVFRSADQGAGWTRVHSFVDWPYPLAIQMFDPRYPQTMYGFATDGQDEFIVKSVDGGGSWRKLPPPITCGGSACGVGMDGLALDPANPDVVYVAGSYAFYHGPSGSFLWSSGDGFVTHRKLTPPAADHAGLFFAPGRHGALYAPTCRRLYQSEDSGSSWRRVGRGLPQSPCSNAGWGAQTLAIDPRDPQRLYFGTGGQGVFVSSDGGATFRAMNRGLESAKVFSVVIDPKNPANLYASVATKGVFRWSAANRTWTPLNDGLPLPAFQGVLALDPQNPSILYAGTSDQGVFRLNLAEP
jgi:photosystem II stability/assembly factor-like uncharacterized protein